MPVTRERLGGLIAFSCCLLGLGALSACEGEPGGARGLTPGELRDKVEELYEAARDAGDDVPSDAYAWAKSDVERIGDWEYRIVRLEAEPDETLTERLAELGSERWEAFWLERQGAELRVFLKRPARSYLRMLPVSELSRLVPLGGSAPSE
ncbi:MAG TPA: hypothetical protein VIY27_06065 [Myxococcota bacterium]